MNINWVIYALQFIDAFSILGWGSPHEDDSWNSLPKMNIILTLFIHPDITYV